MKILSSAMMLILFPFVDASADENPKNETTNQMRTAVLTEADTHVCVSTLWTSETNPNGKNANSTTPVNSAIEPNNEVPFPNDFVDEIPRTDKTKKTDPKTLSLLPSAKQKHRPEKRNPNRPSTEYKMTARPVGPIADFNNSEAVESAEQVALPSKRLTIYADSSRSYGNLY